MREKQELIRTVRDILEKEKHHHRELLGLIHQYDVDSETPVDRQLLENVLKLLEKDELRVMRDVNHMEKLKKKIEKKVKRYRHLQARIKEIYEELYDVRGEMTLGGFITHRYQYRGSSALQNPILRRKLEAGLRNLAKQHKLSEEELKRVFSEFADEWEAARKKVDEYISPAYFGRMSVPIDDLEEYLKYLESIKNNPRFSPIIGVKAKEFLSIT